MKAISLSIITSIFLISCIPGSKNDQIDSKLLETQALVADQDFKKAIGAIELHKLRNGSYPNTLYELKYLNAFDSSIMHTIEYYKLDSGYELNLKMRGVSITGEERALPIKYPADFWKGLGCVKSNTK